MRDAVHTGEPLVRHVSPDGGLSWRVQRDVEHDGSVRYTAGFEGLSWHVHAEDLKRDGEPLAKVLAVTAELLDDRLVIVEETWPARTPDDVRTLRLLLDLEIEVDTKANDEMWQLRFWSGRTVDAIDDLIDGKIGYLPLDQKLFASD